MLNRAKKDFRIWIVSGPSGSGKTSLCDELLKDRIWGKKLLKSVSYTTRPRRKGEVEGKDYLHVNRGEFLRLLSQRAFLEHEQIFGCYYGTPRHVVEDAQKRGRDLLLCIDVKGAETVRKVFKKKATSIFIRPPDMSVLIERLKRRSTENKKEIQKRLARVKIELALAKKYDYVVVNDDFGDALKKLKRILRGEKP